MTTILLLGLALGLVLSPYVRKAFKRLRKNESEAQSTAEKEAFAKGREKGKMEALTVLAETDENAAIIEALGTGVLHQKLYGECNTEEAVRRAAMANESKRFYYSLNMYGIPHSDTSWHWSSAMLARASLTAVGATPRDAYRSYMAQRDAAKAICEQLDEVDRVRKENKV